MNREEQVGFVLVGYVRARLERNKHIRRTGIYHLDVRIILLKQFTRTESETQVEVFLLGNSTHSARILAAVTGVNHYCIGFVCPEQKGHPERQYE